MMKNRIKWITTRYIPVVMLAVIFCSCDNNKGGYEGDVDLNLLNLTQACEIWDGSECNVTTTFTTNDAVKNFTYKVSASLYQKRVAQQDAGAHLQVDKDTLSKAIALAPNGGIYGKYANAILVPEDCFRFSGEQLILNAGKKESDAITVTVHSSMLANLVKKTKKSATFVLPLKIEDSSTYAINPKTSNLMLFFHVKYVESDTPDPTEPDPRDPATELDGMRLVWNEEFNNNGALDSEKWSFEKGFARNQELQWYQESNAECLNGALVITGKKERVKNPNYQAGSGDWKKNREYAEYTSTSITSSKSFHFKYGRMLVRAKIPVAMGAWPAIWTVGNWWEWPLGGEIDILEYYLVNGVPSIHANACWGSNTRWSGTWDSYNCPLTNFTSKNSKWTSEYHIWRMDWDKDYIKLYLDDELLNTIELNKTVNGSGGVSGIEGAWQNPFSNSNEGFGQYVILNLAIGANGGTPDDSKFPMRYFVDYVRVYQLAN